MYKNIYLHQCAAYTNNNNNNNIKMFCVLHGFFFWYKFYESLEQLKYKSHPFGFFGFCTMLGLGLPPSARAATRKPPPRQEKLTLQCKK